MSTLRLAWEVLLEDTVKTEGRTLLTQDGFLPPWEPERHGSEIYFRRERSHPESGLAAEPVGLDLSPEVGMLVLWTGDATNQILSVVPTPSSSKVPEGLDVRLHKRLVPRNGTPLKFDHTVRYDSAGSLHEVRLQVDESGEQQPTAPIVFSEPLIGHVALSSDDLTICARRRNEQGGHFVFDFSLKPDHRNAEGGLLTTLEEEVRALAANPLFKFPIRTDMSSLVIIVNRHVRKVMEF